MQAQQGSKPSSILKCLHLNAYCFDNVAEAIKAFASENRFHYLFFRFEACLCLVDLVAAHHCTTFQTALALC